MTPPAQIGAVYLGRGRTRFAVWAPFAKRAQVHLIEPDDKLIDMEEVGGGYFAVDASGVKPGSRYKVRLNGKDEFPDPVSRYQPEGVHGPSEVIDPDYKWKDVAWRGLPLDDYVVYELHIGTFTEKGTFEAVIPNLDRLKELGVTAVELMPVAQFPGERNWGYDGVSLFAVQNSYGGPKGLKKLVDACHQRGMAAILDVVYNHLGPEGNYLSNFGPYFTDKYHTPWGKAVNFDDAGNRPVRRFFIENALQWVDDYHFDGLRLDAIHAIFDQSAIPFLAELGEAVHERSERLGRHIHLIAESDLNDPRVVLPRELNGWGLDSQWSDDLHHAIHAILTGETAGYYADFGGVDHLQCAYRDGFVYGGRFSAYRDRVHGAPASLLRAEHFVVCSQNHDQVGNRAAGERLNEIVSIEALKASTAAVLLSPFVPMLFMGQEYAEPAPFQYFVSHGDKALIEAVRKGRREEFSSFKWQGEVPDPQAEATFERSRLDHKLREKSPHKEVLAFTKELLRLRRETPALRSMSRAAMTVSADRRCGLLYLLRSAEEQQALVILNFTDTAAVGHPPAPPGAWRLALNSLDRRWAGPGAEVPDSLPADGPFELEIPPHCVLLYVREEEPV